MGRVLKHLPLADSSLLLSRRKTPRTRGTGAAKTIDMNGDFELYTSGHYVPLDLSVQTLLRKNALLKRRDLHAHLHYFSKETALRTLEDTGYRVLDTFYTPRSNELGTGPVQEVLTPPRRVLFALSADWAVRLLGGYSLLVLAS